MLSDSKTGTREPSDSLRSGRRLSTYRVSSVLATLLFLFFVVEMLMVPGFWPADKLWRLAVSAAALATSLGIGTWKFRTTEAPIMSSPIDSLLSATLLLELVWCVAGIISVFARMQR
jgi:hypothetical protein